MARPPLEEFGFDLPLDEWVDRVRQAVLTPPLGFISRPSEDAAATLEVDRERGGIRHGGSLELTISLPTAAITAADSLPKQIGAYRILREIGRGGMGVVYEAEQPRPQRTVALKVMRPGITGTSALRRFELEAHVLGRLQHPGIAQIYEAGVAQSIDGLQPFFAMEFIRGTTIHRFVAESKLGIRERLRMMAAVCDAVHYAHQRGVIHRDLKPGNILVDESGQPKILDFGVARAIDDDMQVTTAHTDVGHIIGTLQYMSPEQISADPSELDIRSDVFSLGVVTYELLTHRLPFDLRGKMIHEAARIIREEEPSRLSTTDRVLRGDIETIVAKAMSKDKALRYGSAAEFAEDIRRFLRDEPIVARPPSTAYQLRKFARRNRTLVGGAVAVFLALTGGLIASSTLYVQSEGRRQEAEDQRQRATENERRADAEAAAARTEANKALTIQGFLQDMLAAADPRRTRQSELTMREVLQAASLRLQDQFTDQPEVRAALERTIGEAYYGLMDFERAIVHLNASVSLYRALGQSTTADFADLLHTLGESYGYHGTGDGIPVMREAVTSQTRLHGESHPKTATAKQYLGFALFRGGLAVGGNETLFAEAEVLAAEALAALRQHADATEEQITRAWHLHTVIIGFMGREADAIETLQEVIRAYQQLFGAHPYTWDCIDDLAMFQVRAGQYAEAVETFEKLVNMGLEVFGDKDNKVAERFYQLGSVASRVGNLAEAEQAFLQSMDIWRRRGEAVSAGAIKTKVAHVNALNRAGHTDRARSMLQGAVFDVRGGAENSGIPSSLQIGAAVSLAEALIQNDDATVAEAILRELVAARATEYGVNDPATLEASYELGRILRQAGKPLEAAELFFRGWTVQQEALELTDRKTLMWMGYYAGCLHDAGQLSEAEEVYRQRYEIRADAGATEDLSYSAADLAYVLRDQQRLAEALPFAREAREIRARIRGKNSAKTVEAETLIVELLQSLGQYDEAFAIRRLRYEASVEAGRASTNEAYEYGKLLRESDRVEDAAEVFKAGWMALQTEDGASPPLALRWMIQYAACLSDLNRREELLGVRQAIGGVAIPTEGALAKGAFNVAVAARRLGLMEEAALVFHTGWQAHRFEDGSTPVQGLVWMGNYAAVLMDLGRVAEAEPLFRQAYEAYRLDDPRSPDTARAALDLSLALHKLGSTADALPLAIESLDIRRESSGPAEDALHDSLDWLAKLREELNEHAESELLRLELVGLLAGTNSAKQRAAIEALIRLYDSWHTAEPDQGHDRQSNEWRAELAAMPASAEPGAP